MKIAQAKGKALTQIGMVIGCRRRWWRLEFFDCLFRRSVLKAMSS